MRKFTEEEKAKALENATPGEMLAALREIADENAVRVSKALEMIETIENGRRRSTNFTAAPEISNADALVMRAAINGPVVNRTKLEARIHDGFHYRDGLARVSFVAPQFANGDELREFAVWILTVADAADLRSLRVEKGGKPS